METKLENARIQQHGQNTGFSLIKTRATDETKGQGILLPDLRHTHARTHTVDIDCKQCPEAG